MNMTNRTRILDPDGQSDPILDPEGPTQSLRFALTVLISSCNNTRPKAKRIELSDSYQLLY